MLIINICRSIVFLNTTVFQKKNIPIRNVELVKNLIAKIESLPLIFTKIKAHQKKTNVINYNRVVDVLAREQVRAKI